MAPILALLLGLDVAPEPVAVTVVNLGGFDLSLRAIDGDAERLVAAWGTEPEFRADLDHGIYVVEGRGRGEVLRWPLPLPRRALVPSTIRLRLELPPAPPPGFAFVPAGPALVGDVLGVGQEDERPARVVEIPAFLIGTTEVTNREFATFLRAAGTPDAAWANLESRKTGFRRGADGAWVTDRPDEPAVTVSWRGARAYCAWMTERTGAVHRLPSEIEWEKAARGPESFTYAYGNTYAVAKANQESGRLLPVASRPANGFGIFDLTGNAFEWTADAYDRTAPAGTVGPAGDGNADPPPELRVLRGGSYVLDGMYLRNSFRMRHRPSVTADDFGFRVVREPAAGRQGG